MSFNSQESFDEVLQKFYHPILEEDMNVQEQGFDFLNRVIDAIVELRLIAFRKTEKMLRIADLDLKIKVTFEEIQGDQLQPLDVLGNQIYDFVNQFQRGEETISRDSIRSSLEHLFRIYCYSMRLPIDETSKFYNELLNRFDASFRRYEKEHIIQELKEKKPLTMKKQTSIVQGRKLLKIASLLRTQDYVALNTSWEELLIKAKQKRVAISKIDELHKKEVFCSEHTFQQLENAFANGILSESVVIGFLQKENSNLESQMIQKVSKKIFNKYQQLLFGFFPYVSLSDQELQITEEDKKSLGFNYNNFVIVENRNIRENLDQLKDLLQQNGIENFPQVSGQEELYEFLSFVNYFPEFQTEQFFSILKNYDRIIRHLNSSYADAKTVPSTSFVLLQNHFDKALQYANGYDSTTDLDLAILGSKVLEKIPSSHAHDYAQFYFKMFQKKCSYLPFVEGTYLNWDFYSGNFLESNRLLIGRNCGSSCIDLLNNNGKKAYTKVLTEQDGDVITIVDEKSKEFYARSLVFRKGNLVMLAPIYNKNGEIAKDVATPEFYQMIGRQILNQAVKAQDNIDFVFTTAFALKAEDFPFPIFEDRRLSYAFPHADISKTALLICSRKPVPPEYIRFLIHMEESPQRLYPMKRRAICSRFDFEHLSKLRALQIKFMPDGEEKTKAAQEFEPFFKEDCFYVFFGEDWYILRKNDGTIHEALVSFEEASVLEFMETKKKLIQEGLYPEEMGEELKDESNWKNYSI